MLKDGPFMIYGAMSFALPVDWCAASHLHRFGKKRLKEKLMRQVLRAWRVGRWVLILAIFGGYCGGCFLDDRGHHHDDWHDHDHDHW